MGFLGKLFGEENEAPSGPPTPVLDPGAQELQNISFPQINRGLRGEGLFPTIRGRSIRDMIAATTEEFGETQRELPGVLARTIPKADFGVRNFIRRSVDASFARTKQGIRESDIGADFEEKNIAQNLAFGALSTEKGTANQILNMFNQTMLARAFSPTFESALFTGLGGAAGTFAGNIRSTEQKALDLGVSAGGAATATGRTPSGGFIFGPPPPQTTPQIGGSSIFNPSNSSRFIGPQTSAGAYSRAFSELPG